MTDPGGSGLLAYRCTEEIDAIAEYSHRLAEALCDRGNPASYDGRGLPRSLPVDGLAWILLQYNPFSYGHWGVAPGLVRAARGIQRRLNGPLGLMVHEAWVDVTDWKSGLMGGYQRLQLRALSRVASVLMATTQSVARALGPRAIHVPVASNVTPVAATRRTARNSLGVSDELIVTVFGRGNPSRLLGHAEAAIAAIAAAQAPRRIMVFNLGADAPVISAGPGVRVVRPGHLSPHDLSLHLWASDLALLPFSDGLSTRRTTLMAALAHAVPVVGVRGRATDDVLLRHAGSLTLTANGDRDAFGRAAAGLVEDHDRLRARGEAGRRLYREHFDWPHVARRVMLAMDGAAATGGDWR